MVDDYGHHPTEIRATLDGARLCGFRRMHVLFQPHRYTRTFHLMDEFARSFHQADSLFVMDIYAASEKPIEGVTAEALVERIRQFGHRSAEYVGTIDRGVDAVLASRRRRRPGADAGRGKCLAGGRQDPGEIAGRELNGARVEKRRGEERAGISLAHCGRWPARRHRLRVDGMAALRVRQLRARRPAVHAVAATSRDALTIEGLRYASRDDPARLRRRTSDAVSSPIPLGERRRRLLAVDWVEDASVRASGRIA